MYICHISSASNTEKKFRTKIPPRRNFMWMRLYVWCVCVRQNDFQRNGAILIAAAAAATTKQMDLFIIFLVLSFVRSVIASLLIITL